MNRDNEKKPAPDLDENALMDLMVDGVRKEGFEVPAEAVEQPEKEKPPTRERSKTKGTSPAEYEELFFKELKYYGLKTHRLDAD